MGEVRVLEAEERPFYTTKTLAKRLVLNERTVRRLLDSGEIPSYYVGPSGTARRIDPEDVDSYLARRRDDRRAA